MPKLPRRLAVFTLERSLQVVAVGKPRLLGDAAIDLLIDQLQANELGIPKHDKIVAVRGRWVAGTSVRGR